MARKQPRAVAPLKLPARLIPDYDRWGSPEEEEKRAERTEWLRDNNLARQYFFEWMPSYLDQRRRLGGLPSRIPARRKGPLPERVRKLIDALPREEELDD